MSEIHTSLAAVMADCTSVAKRDRNEHQRFLFRGIDAVVNAVGPILRKHAVTVVPQVRTVTYDTVQTTTGKPSTACRIVADYLFMAADGSSVTATVAAEAWDHGDKATPKAMSVAFRTALLQALALPTDEPEPDAHTYERVAPGEPTAASGGGGVRRMSRAQRAPAASGEAMTDAQGRALWPALKAAGFDYNTDDGKREVLAYMSRVTGRPVTTTKELTRREASLVLDALTTRQEAQA